MMAQSTAAALPNCRDASPASDMTTQNMVQAEEDGQQAHKRGTAANIILWFGAGHETTVN